MALLDDITMLQIALTNAKWSLDPQRQLGRKGGFGAVYLGVAADGSEVAVKQLNVDAVTSAGRELRLASVLAGRRLQHVMPVLDAGLDANSDRYYIVMPRAAHSLQSEIDRRGTFPVKEAASILIQILRGLEEVSDVVHRDLKPDNILWHEGVWKIADFGIARFVAESTSVNTLRNALSGYYAAPEQWRFETATAATDLYALGCIAFSLVTGRPPFRDIATLSEDHEMKTPPTLSSGDSRLDTLVALLLRKVPETRPSRTRCMSVLNDVSSGNHPAANGSLDRLRNIGVVDAQRAAADEARQQQELAERRLRASLSTMANTSLDTLARRLMNTISREVPTARVSAIHGGTYSVTASRALLEIQPVVYTPRYTKSLVQAAWDVVATARIGVTQNAAEYKWFASLYFMRMARDPEFRWFEISFFSFVGGAKFEPFELDPSDAEEAAGPGLHSKGVAFGPSAIDGENEERFQQRWIELFIRAYEGNLRHPRSLPLPDDGLER